MYIFLSSLLVLGILFIFLSTKKPITRRGQKLPPGKLGWPMIGETLDFVSSGRKGSYHKFIRDRMNQHSPEIFKTSLLGDNMVVPCGPSGNKFIFSNENKLFVSWWPSTMSKMVHYGPELTSELKKLRHSLSKFLRPEALQKYVPIIDSMTEEHFNKKWVTPNNQVKVYPISKNLTFALACRLFIGLEDSDHVAQLEGYFSLVTAGMTSIPIDFVGTKFNRGIKAVGSIRNELLPIIKLRRSQLVSGEIEDNRKQPNFLSQLLLDTDEDGKFYEDVEIAEMIFGVLLASHDNTCCAMTFVVYYLADHPHVHDRVLEEQMEILKSKGVKKLLQWKDIQRMKYSRNVADEVLRLSPPGMGGFKEAISDFTYAGFSIPRGWKVFWSVHTTHRNPEYFPNPEKFDPSRFEGNGVVPYTFVPFGGGPRMCPGAEFFRLEILTFIHCLVTKFKWEKLIPDEKIICKLTPEPVDGLPVRLFPHVN